MRHAVLVLVAFAACALYHWVGLTHFAGPNYDDVVYVVMGKAIVTGQGYHLISQPGAPMQVAYPPVYPLLLGLVWLLFPTWPANLLAFKALNIVAVFVAAGLLAWWVRTRYGATRLATALTAYLAATSAAVTQMIDLTMSEMVFMAVVVAALIGIERAVEPQPLTRGADVRAGVVAALWVGLVMLTKSIGLTLALAAGLWLLWRRRWAGAAAYAATVGLVNLPWVAWVWYARHSGAQATVDYAAWAHDNIGLAGLLHTLASNGERYWHFSFPLVLSGFSLNQAFASALGHLHLAGALALVGQTAIVVALGGLALQARQQLTVMHVYVAVFVLFVWAFPWEPTRYTTTLTPLLCYGLVLGCTALVQQGRLGHRLAAVFLTLACLGPLARVGSLLAHHATHDALLPPAEQRLLQDRAAFTTWARARTPQNAIFIHDRDPLAFLDTGRQAFTYNGGPRPDARTRALFAARPTYLVLFPGHGEFQSTHQALRPWLGPVMPAFQGPEGTMEVYRVPAAWPGS